MQWQDFLAPYDKRLFSAAEGRRAIGARSPLLFSLIYFREHLRDHDRNITLSPVHTEWSDMACELKQPTGLREWRHALAAPRSMGKSTWWFLFIPTWLGAYGYRKFVSAFADSASLAQRHLLTFKTELANNELLRHDFPEFCTPARRPGGMVEADRVDLYIAQSRFAFSALGADSKLLGMKIGSTRPDLLILDDIEGDESSYSPDKSVKRLRTITDAILPLNERAGVVLTGTVTMVDSIVHQAVKAANGREPEEWIKDEEFVCHHHKPILKDDFGGESSVWPEKWSLEYLISKRHTRSYAKNMLNDPIAEDGQYWDPAHFKYGFLDNTNIRLLSVDPHVKRGKATDFTGISVVRYSTPYDMFDVPWSIQTKLRGGSLRELVIKMINEYDITAVLVETNQGGDMWTDDNGVFANLPCKVLTIHQKESKEIRAARALAEYECERVLHRRGLEDLEAQMLAFPRVVHDDMVDSVTSGIIEIRKRVGESKNRVVHSEAIQAKWSEAA
jgi:hypothetical protein